MSNHIDDARNLIQSRLDAIEAEADQLSRALESLGEKVRPRRGPRRRSPGAETNMASASGGTGRPTRGRGKRPKRAARGQRREEVLAAIAADPGARAADLARSVGIRPTQVHAVISKARAEKLVVKSGDGYALRK